MAQTIFVISTLVASIFIIKRNPRSLINRLFFLAYILYATIGTSIWIYSTFPYDVLIQSFVRIALSASAFAVVFLYLGTKVVFHSTIEVKKKVFIRFLVTATILAAFIASFPDLVVTLSYDPVNNQANNFAFLIIMLWQIILVTRVIIIVLRLYRIALKKLEVKGNEGGKKPFVIVKMRYVIIGHTFGLVGIYLLIIGNFLGSPVADFLFYALSSIDFIFTAYAVLKQEKVVEEP
ncbi:MAG: hypothetical protein ACFFCS_05715 [Candidatus Hodarchaeota archaeon]